MSGRGLAGCLTAAVVVLGGIGSIVAFFLSTEGYLPGDAMVRTWATAKDRPGDGKENGRWVVGDVAVRSRFDAVTGFGIADGHDDKKLWEFVPPGRTQICGSARSADETVLLVAYGTERLATTDSSGKPAVPGEGEGCSTVLALDVKDGRELWTAPRTVSDGRFPGNGFLDSGGGLALVLHERTKEEVRAPGGNRSLRALDLRTGQARWTAAVPGACGVWQAAVGEEQIHAVLACDGDGDGGGGGGGSDATESGSVGDAELMAAAFDRATGALKWNVPIDTRRPVSLDSTVVIESPEPLVLRVKRPSTEGSGVYVPFSPEGKPRPVIEFTGDKDKIDPADRTQTAFAGDRMYALVWHWKKGRNSRLVAFDLKTGEKEWSKKLDEPAAGLNLQGDRITVLCEWSTQASAITDLYVYDAGDGEELDERHFRDEVPGRYFFEHDGRIIVAGADADRAFTAYERW